MSDTSKYFDQNRVAASAHMCLENVVHLRRSKSECLFNRIEIMFPLPKSVVVLSHAEKHLGCSVLLVIKSDIYYRQRILVYRSTLLQLSELKCHYMCPVLFCKRNRCRSEWTGSQKARVTVQISDDPFLVIS